MNKQWTIFLDLEETLIQSWEDRVSLIPKIDAISGFIKRTLIIDSRRRIGRTISRGLQIPRIGLMSWAVWDDRDKEIFNEEIRPSLDFKFDDELVWSMQDWGDLVLRNTGLKLSRQDIFDMCNKETVLFWLRNATHGFPEGEVTLIDDAVTHNNVIISDTRKITILNVDKL